MFAKYLTPVGSWYRSRLRIGGLRGGSTTIRMITENLKVLKRHHDIRGANFSSETKQPDRL